MHKKQEKKGNRGFVFGKPKKKVDLCKILEEICLSRREACEHHDSIICQLNKMEGRIMTKISEFAEKVNAHHEATTAALGEVSTAVQGVSDDVAGLKALIEELQNTPGEITPEDQALLDSIEAKAGETSAKVTEVATALKALDELTPPTPPVQ